MSGSIALLSGGLDSIVATALAHTTSRVHTAITFDYGQRARAREMEIARTFCKRHHIEHRVIELPWLKAWTRTALVDTGRELPRVTPSELENNANDRAHSVWVPNRNGLLINIAAALADALSLRYVVAGFNAEEAVTFPDNSQAFLESINKALHFSTLSQVELISPTIAMGKAEIAEHFVELALDPQLFWCCYEGGEHLCGTCESCARTIRAFTKIGEMDLIRNRFTEATFTENV